MRRGTRGHAGVIIDEELHVESRFALCAERGCGSAGITVRVAALTLAVSVQEEAVVGTVSADIGAGTGHDKFEPSAASRAHRPRSAGSAVSTAQRTSVGRIGVFSNWA